MLSISRKSSLGALAVSAIAIAAACGGGGGDGDGDSATADGFRAQADAICARFDPQFDALEQPTAPDEVRPFLVEALALGQAQTAELAALEAPDELSELAARAIANNEEAAELIEGAIERIDSGEAIGPIVDNVAEEGERIEEEGEQIAQEMGLEVCGVDEDEVNVTTTENPPDDFLDPDAEPTTTTDERSDTVENAAAQYLLDVNAASTSLNAIGAIFTNADDADALQAQAAVVQENVGEFNGAIDSMGTYTLDDPQLEQQRAGFVDAGEGLEEPLADLSAAVADGDLAAIAATLPALQAAAEEFQEVVAQTP